MINKRVNIVLIRIGILSSILFPASLIISFITHHMGEYNFADLLKIKFAYVPPSPERFVELFSSSSIMDFIIPHIIIYLAIPLAIPAIIFKGSLLFKKKPWVTIIGVCLSLIGIVFMGGVFGTWLSFTAIGNLNSNQLSTAIPIISELTKNQGILMLTSLLAGLSLFGFMIIAVGLFFSKDIPNWQSTFIFIGNAIIIVFMDIDNLMLFGSLLWFLGTLPFARMWNSTI